MEDLQIWSVAVDPSDSDTIFAGTRPNAFRSKDGGKSWEHLDIGVIDPCPIGTARTTNIIVDPRNPAEKPCCDGMAWRITSGL